MIAALKRIPERWPELVRWLKIALAVAVLGLAAFLLRRALQGQDPAVLWQTITAAPAARLWGAFGFALASYACLTLFDYLALRYAGKPLAYPRVALASFTSLSLGHNLGFAALSSGAIRYRFYSRWGLSGVEVAKVILFCGATVGIGLAMLTAISLALQPELAIKLTGLSPLLLSLIGGGIVLLLIGYLAACAFWRGERELRGHRVKLPSLRLALGQFAIGTVNFALVAACLQQALAIVAETSYPDVAAAYVLANLATLVSHVPGGLGVIETVVGHLFGAGEVIAGLVLFRLVYFIVPLICGALLFAASELFIQRAATGSAAHDRPASASAGAGAPDPARP